MTARDSTVTGAIIINIQICVILRKVLLIKELERKCNRSNKLIDLSYKQIVGIRKKLVKLAISSKTLKN